MVTLIAQEGTNVNSVYSENGGSTPLTLAVAGGHLEAVQLLLKHGATVAFRNSDDGTTPSTLQPVVALMPSSIF